MAEQDNGIERHSPAQTILADLRKLKAAGVAFFEEAVVPGSTASFVIIAPVEQHHSRGIWPITRFEDDLLRNRVKGTPTRTEGNTVFFGKYNVDNHLFVFVPSPVYAGGLRERVLLENKKVKGKLTHRELTRLRMLQQVFSPDRADIKIFRSKATTVRERIHEFREENMETKPRVVDTSRFYRKTGT